VVVRRVAFARRISAACFLSAPTMSVLGTTFR
jgi:hypothetical protein